MDSHHRNHLGRMRTFRVGLKRLHCVFRRLRGVAFPGFVQGFLDVDALATGSLHPLRFADPVGDACRLARFRRFWGLFRASGRVGLLHCLMGLLNRFNRVYVVPNGVRDHETPVNFGDLRPVLGVGVDLVRRIGQNLLHFACRLLVGFVTQKFSGLHLLGFLRLGLFGRRDLFGLLGLAFSGCRLGTFREIGFNSLDDVKSPFGSHCGHCGVQNEIHQSLGSFR